MTGKTGEDPDEIYDDIEDGDGCAEIWEKLSDRRREKRESEND
jgi:hypothetical protein